MVEEVNGLISNLIELHQEFINNLSVMGFEYVGTFINIMLLILLIFIYCLFIWKFYKFIAARDFLGKYSDKFNFAKDSVSMKLIYSIEYIILSPFLIFIGFVIFTFFLILLTNVIDITTLLIISTTIVATIRMTSYYNEELSREIAKILPFTLLAISIINPEFFNVERVLNRLELIPSLFEGMLIYLIFIIILEVFLRFFGFLFSIFGLEDETGMEQE